MKFTEFNLNSDLQKGINNAGFVDCMPVQEETLTQAFMGKDVCVQSQTGSGKTVAFLISMYQLLLTNDKMKGRKSLVIVPTRELAVQIEKEAKLLNQHLKFLVGSFYGGVGYVKQEKLIKSGVDIIIGTPGRLIDFGNSNKINFKDIGILVIDEADRLFDMGFLPDIKTMLAQMVPQTERHTLLFSATISDRVRELAGEYLNNPVNIEIDPEQVTVESVSQKIYHVGQNEKMKLLLGILKKENPGNAFIFANTKHKAVEVAKRLEHNGYKCHYIMGDLPQSKRLKIIDGLKSGKIKYLVATNVAARGLHMDDLEMVINYDIPLDCEDYVHRIGRTARVGKSGKAISLACEKFVYGLEAIESLINMKIPVEWADDELFVEDKSAGIDLSSKRGGMRKPYRKMSRERSTGVVRDRGNAMRHERKGKQSETSWKKSTDVSSKVNRKTTHGKTGYEKINKKMSLDDRIEYYNRKYGENFKVKDELKIADNPKRKKSFFQEIFHKFKKK